MRLFFPSKEKKNTTTYWKWYCEEEVALLTEHLSDWITDSCCVGIV